MNQIVRKFALLAAVAALALPLAACKEEAPVKVEKPAVPVPTNDDPAAWRAYVSDVVSRNAKDVSASPYVYLVPQTTTADFEDAYARLTDKAKADVARGVLPGSMLAFAASQRDSSKAAELAVAAISSAGPDKLRDVKVLYIGTAAEGEQVKAAVGLSAATVVVVEAK